ncbi:MAG: hypothetical protein EOP06_19885 [Proteobacteria bacterium]|nr:MAG: hypothetical protein EOP06_19885 [Pseudomonadota bacterium]
MWFSDGSLRGIHKRKFSRAGLFPFDLIPMGLDTGIFAVALFLLLIPIFIIYAVFFGCRERKLNERMDTLNPTSDEYLAWNRSNFRLQMSEIHRAEFFEPLISLSCVPLAQHLRLYLQNGDSQHFTLAHRQDAEQLQILFEQGGVATTRRDTQRLSSYLSQKLSRV